MKIKHLLPKKIYNRLCRKYNLSGVSVDIMSVHEDSPRYDGCLVYRVSPDVYRKYDRKIQAQMKRDRNNAMLSFARIMS